MFFCFFFCPPGINCLLTESDSGLFFLPPNSSAVGVGFYGNSETNDGVYQLTYSLHNANHTLGSVENLVRRKSGEKKKKSAVRRLVIGAHICDVYGARNSRIPPAEGSSEK